MRFETYVKSSLLTKQDPPFYRPDVSNQLNQSTEGKGITFHGIAHHKFTLVLPVLSSATKDSR